MGLFKGIREAKGTEGGNYFKPGNYVVMIERCKEGETRHAIPFFVAECRILKVDIDDPNLVVGRVAAFFVKFDEYPELSLGNVGDFMTAGMKSWFLQHNEPVPEGFFGPGVSEETADAIVSEENILAGTVLAVEAYNKDTKSGNPFTRFRWLPLKSHEDYAQYL